MISLKQLRAEAKRVLGPSGQAHANDRHCAEAYRCFLSKKAPPFVALRVSANSKAEARQYLYDALKGMPDFEGSVP